MEKNSFLTKFFNVIIFLTINQYIIAQANIEWVRTYNGPANDDDIVNDMFVDSLDNIYLTGYSYGTNSDKDVYTIKYNSSGNVIWSDRYNGSGNSADQGNKIIVAKSGNTYVAGLSRGITSQTDILVIKYDVSGEKLWTRTFNGALNGYDIGADIKLDSLENVFIGGYGQITNSYNDAILLKYDSTGNLLWFKSYNGTTNVHDTFELLEIDFFGNIYAAGGSNDNNQSYLTVIKYSNTGNIKWVNKFYSLDVLREFTFGKDKNLYAVCGGQDYFIVKYDTSGNTIWSKTYNGPGNSTDYCNAIDFDAYNNVFVTGSSSGSQFASNVGCTSIKYTSAGNMVWIKNYRDTSYSFNRGFYGQDLKLDLYSNLYIAGHIGGGLGTSEEGLLLKFDSTGVFQWCSIYDVGYNDYFTEIISNDNFNSFYVVGNTELSNQGYNFLLIKYSQVNSVINLNENISNSFNLRQNYPNPFNPVTNIKFDIPKKGFIKLAVYDVLGKEIAILASQQLNPGVYKASWDASGLPSGVYFYRITASNFTDTKRMILLK